MSVFAFIDGFNIYHLLDTHYAQTQENLKWLSYPALMSQIAKQPLPGEQVYFFTAQPTHVSNSKQDRYRLFCKAQAMMGVHIVEWRFKQGDAKCKAHQCGQYLEYTVNQEKQTDVNIALTLLVKSSLPFTIRCFQ